MNYCKKYYFQHSLLMLRLLHYFLCQELLSALCKDCATQLVLLSTMLSTPCLCWVPYKVAGECACNNLEAVQASRLEVQRIQRCITWLQPVVI